MSVVMTFIALGAFFALVSAYLEAARTPSPILPGVRILKRGETIRAIGKALRDVAICTFCLAYAAMMGTAIVLETWELLQGL